MNISEKHGLKQRANGALQPEGENDDWQKRLGLKASPPAIDKAGIVVHGMLNHDPLTHQPLSKPTHYVVAPWSQGRFSDDGTKLYFLAKGSVDAHESSFAAAMRESYEETGINIAAIAQGMISGASLHEDSVVPLERMILGSSGNPWHTQIFSVQVDGLDHLVPHLKNPQAQIAGSFAETVTPESKPYAREQALPVFEEMLHWLRSGIMPRGHWNAGKNVKGTTLATVDAFNELEQSVMQELLAERKKKGATGQPLLPGRAVGDDDAEIKSPTEFGIFRDRLNVKDCAWLDARLKQIKRVLAGYNIATDDHAPVKLDMKERPLQFYQEGADLIPMSEYLTRIVNQSLVNGRYDRNMVGSRIMSGYKHGPNHHLLDSVARKEIAMLAPVITVDDIEEAQIPRSIKHALHAIMRGYNPDKETLSR